MKRNEALPFIFALCGLALLCIMDALLKDVGARYPTFQLALVRFLCGSLWAISAVAILRPAFPSSETIRINALRGTIGAFTATTFFYAIQTLPLADAIAISFISPLFLALFGALILREKIGRYTGVGLIVGFGGMLVMAFGQGMGGAVLHLPGVAAALASAVMYAMSMTLLRQRAQQDALIIIVLFQNIVPATILLIPGIIVWVPMRPSDILMFLTIGGLGLAGHFLLAMAFKRAEAARLAPTEYTALLYAAALGYVFFGEVPGLATWLGSGLIMLGTFVAMRQRAH
jgi:drug/metabolite transporter (DMT)-like permease